MALPMKKGKDRTVLKVFCPVCDVPFTQEAELFEHLEASHDLKLGSGGGGARGAKAAEDGDAIRVSGDEGEWVVVEQPNESAGADADWVDVGAVERWGQDDMLLREPPPPAVQRGLLLGLTGAEREMKGQEGAAWFRQAFSGAFPNGTLPSEFFQLPLFGSTVNAAVLSVAEKRLLCVVGHHFPETNFCPVLVSLLHLSSAVVGCSDEECLALLFALLRQKEKLLKKAALKQQAVSLIATSKSQLKLLATAVHKLVLANVKKAPFAALGIEAGDYALSWCALFFDNLPPLYRVHALCLWAAQGASAVIRLAIGLVSVAVESASGAALADKDLLLSLFDSVLATMDAPRWKRVLEQAYKVRKWFLRDAKIRAISAADTAQLRLDEDMVVSATYFRPVACGSILQREEQWDFLWSRCLPERFKQQQPVVLFSASQGWSWKMLLKTLVNQPRVILMLQGRERSVFGAVLVRGFEKSKEGVFVADREARLVDLTRLQSFEWRFGREDYVAQWSDERICIGCDVEGRVALMLDQALEYAHMDACNVFGCEGPISADGEKVAIVKLEVYKF